MNGKKPQLDWSKTTFEGVCKDQLRHALRMTVRERLEAMDELSRLSERLQGMPKWSGEEPTPESGYMVDK